jgi:hypothetical protein
MHDAIGPVGGHDGVNGRPVGQVALYKDGVAMDGVTVALVQVVKDDHFFAGLD